MQATNDQLRTDLSSEGDEKYQEKLRVLVAAAGGNAAFKLPLEPSEAVTLFRTLGYRASEVVFNHVFDNEPPAVFGVTEIRLAHRRLERLTCWLPWPNGIHDRKKSAHVLSCEVAGALSRMELRQRRQAILSFDVRQLLVLLAAAIDSETQAALLEYTLIRLGLDE